MNNKKTIILLILSILIVIAATVGITFAYLSISSTQTNPNTLSSSCFDVSFTENTTSINLRATYPMSDTKGIATNPYTFTIALDNACTTNTNYQVILNIKSTTNEEILPYIVYSLDNANGYLLSNATKITLPVGALSSNVIASYVLDINSLNTTSSTKTYNLRLWLAEHGGNNLMNKNFEAEIMVYSVPDNNTNNSIEKATLTNLIPDPSFEGKEWSIVSYDSKESLYGNRSSKLPGGAGIKMNTISMPKPIVNHIYYGRHSIKTEGSVSAGDDRFEWFAGDGAGLNFIFGHNSGNHAEWFTESALINVTAVNGASYVIRNFTVNPTANLWSDGLMIIDLTAAFGAGNEPTKEWCDNNIPFFQDTKSIAYFNTK